MDGIIVVGVLLLIVAVAVVVIYNGIIKAGNGAERAWANVIAYERLKLNVLPLIEKAAADYRNFEDSVLRGVTQLRSAIGGLDQKSISTEQLAAVETLTRQVQRGINVTLEAYPDLKLNTVVQQMMREISEKNENVAAAIAVFNENVENFNNRISIFPNSLVNSMLLRKEKLQTFRDAAADGSFDYKPNFS